MAEDEDLEVLGPVVLALLATADEETREGSGDEVEERPHRPIVPGLSERESGFPTLTGIGPPVPVRVLVARTQATTWSSSAMSASTSTWRSGCPLRIHW
jgi:hypothetical protein